MKKLICENEYCKRFRYDKSLPIHLECPYCGCKYITVEDIPDILTPNKQKRKKK